jgi:DNA-binding CsgD family transcriptional regulator/tetratricopeptide (TPR) repeat protein
MLLERDTFLKELDDACARAASGMGGVVLVSGEAGIGKTTLVEHFARTLEECDSAVRVLWGACDALFTPRPLGPLLDIARQAQGPLRSLAEGTAERERLFAALLAELSQSPHRTLAILEDVHWADEATLDLLKFVGRRVRHTRGLVVLTYRDDELDTGHPLRRVLGELPRDAVRRLQLPPLSEAAVARLARAAGRKAEDLHTVTGGNPFYVTEILAARGMEIPASVRDAVLARAAGLGPEARAAMDVVAVVPGRTERWLLDAVLSPTDGAVKETMAAGILRGAVDFVAFRHELARRAWEEAIEPGRAAALHRAVLRTLTDRGERALLPRMIHHAERSGDGATVLQLAPTAARDAAAVGAHREAAAHYGSALRHADGCGPAERAELLDAWSYEVHLGGRIAEAVRARQEAIGLWRGIGERVREGDSLRCLSRLAWFEGRRQDAAHCAAEAIRVLEPLGPSHELAMAYSTRAQLHILAEERRLAPEWGDRAVTMAEALGDTEALVHALTNAACLEPGAGRELQLRAVRLAQQHGMHEHALRAYAWLISDSIQERQYEPAEDWLAEALAYAGKRDIDTFANYLRGWRARMRTEQGRFAEAETDAAEVLGHADASTVVRLPSLTALATVRVRQGDPGARDILDEALELALSTGELQRIAPVAAARAEAAWLRGDADTVRTEAMPAYTHALAVESLWDAGCLASWLRRAGALDDPPRDLPGPYAAELAGNWCLAAQLWERTGCPFEQALALAEGDERAQRQAIALLEGIGAAPAASLLRRQFQQRGVRGLPRGPRPSTRENPALLTRRQMDVLALLADGLSNREIASRLFLSPRTIDHHVSAILQKLETESRAGAAALARQRGLLSPQPADERAAGARIQKTSVTTGQGRR